MSWLWSVQSFLDDVVTGIQDTVERVIYDPSGPLYGIKDIIEEKERENEYERIERKINNNTFEEDEGEGGILKELWDACTELKNSLEEIFTVGAYEMLVKGNSDWKTSSDLMEEANRLVEEAVSVYETQYGKTTQAIAAINGYVETTDLKKRKLADKFNVIIAIAEEKWRLKNNSIFTPKFKKLYQTPVRISAIEYVSRPHIDIANTLGFTMLPATIAMTAISGNSRINAAKENLEDAKDFVIRVKTKVIKLQEICVRIQDIRNILDEENVVLDVLLEKKVDGDKANKYAEQLKKLLVEEIVLEDGALNMNYQKAVKALGDTIQNIFGY